MPPTLRSQLRDASLHGVAFLLGLLSGDLLFEPETLTLGEVGSQALLAVAVVLVLWWTGRFRRA
jgi:hypothetical protein